MRLDHLLYREMQEILLKLTRCSHLSVSLKLDCSLKIWKETKRSVKRSCRDEMAVDVDRRVVIAIIDSLKFSRTDIIREISVYVIGCL